MYVTDVTMPNGKIKRFMTTIDFSISISKARKKYIEERVERARNAANKSFSKELDMYDQRVSCLGAKYVRPSTPKP
jgi:replication-associated recombination protein RarA